MRPDNDRHIDEAALLRAIVDRGELNERERQHLSNCPQCASAVDLLEADLAVIGPKAQACSPLLSRPIRLPDKRTPKVSRWSWRWTGSVGMALTALLILVVLWSVPRTRPPNDQGPSIDDPTIPWHEDAFMSEIRHLTENALPDAYRSLVVMSDGLMDDDFIRFMVPEPDPESLSHQLTKRGVKSC
ncbi:MAG: hypothetical protein V2J25_15360 [Desulfatiglans sp.]|nr:hypothetical protein [Desulfatiglans sp.]